uniref:hypothetical protein n=1 Tax=Pseudomonas mohnii TaxID=395600 RepID=UPI001A7E7C77
NFFDFGVGTHHEVLAPERDRERSIGLQWAALNVWVMDRLQFTWPGTRHGSQMKLSAEQLHALILGLPWQRVGPGNAISIL